MKGMKINEVHGKNKIKEKLKKGGEFYMTAKEIRLHDNRKKFEKSHRWRTLADS